MFFNGRLKQEISKPHKQLRQLEANNSTLQQSAAAAQAACSDCEAKLEQAVVEQAHHLDLFQNMKLFGNSFLEIQKSLAKLAAVCLACHAK